MSVTKIQTVGIIIFLALASNLFVTPAVAASGASFSLRPERYDPSRPETKSYFVFDGTQGGIIDSQVRVSNTGDETGTAYLYAVDATTGQTSGTVFRMQEDPRSLAGSWLELEIASVKLAPGESQLVPFSVSIPADARPGEHIAGIVVQGAQTSSHLDNSGQESADFRVQISGRMAVAVQVNLPGEQKNEMEVKGIYSGGSNGRQKLYLQLQNLGNLMVKPQGSVVVLNSAGEPVQKFSFSLNTILPETAIDYPLFVENEALDVGEYTVQVALEYGGGKTLARELPLVITEAELVQVFEGQQALSAPASLAGSQHPSENGISTLLLIALTVVVLILLAVVGMLIVIVRRSQPNGG